jgi:hypothetical protein
MPATTTDAPSKVGAKRSVVEVEETNNDDMMMRRIKILVIPATKMWKNLKLPFSI